MVSSDKWKFGGLLTLLLLVPFSPAIAAPANAASTEASFTVLWSFSTPPGGLASNPALFAPVQSGPRYGTTLFGGDFQRGSVYELIPPSLHNGAWHKSVLWSFGGKDGAFPHPGLVDVGPRGRVGALCGTTAAGATRDAGAVFNDAPIDRSPYATVTSVSAKGAGAVFKLIPPTKSGAGWSETVLHSFAGPDGLTPEAGLLLDKSGVLYGIASWGGAHR